MSKRLFLYSCLQLACLTTAAQADDIIKETFDSAAGGELVATVESTTTWTTRGQRAGLAVVDDPSGLNHGNALEIKNALAYAMFKDVTIKEGDSLELSFRFRYRDSNREAGFPLRVGLFNTSSGNPDDGGSPGYWYFTNENAEKGTSWIGFEEGTDPGLGGGNDVKALGTYAPSSNSGMKVASVTLTITHASDGIHIDCQNGDNAPLQVVDAASQATTFNGLAFSIIGSQEEMVVDDIVLSLKPAAK